jgi:hypothetical protein
MVYEISGLDFYSYSCLLCFIINGRKMCRKIDVYTAAVLDCTAYVLVHVHATGVVETG